MNREHASILFGYGCGVIVGGLLMHFANASAAFAALLIAGAICVVGALVAALAIGGEL